MASETLHKEGLKKFFFIKSHGEFLSFIECLTKNPDSHRRTDGHCQNNVPSIKSRIKNQKELMQYIQEKGMEP